MLGIIYTTNMINKGWHKKEMCFVLKVQLLHVI